MPKNSTKTTFSMWNSFKNCRKLAKLRYIDKLVPNNKKDCLNFGAIIHDCLEIYHSHYDLSLVQVKIDQSYPQRNSDPASKKEWHYATAMIKGYVKRYKNDSSKFNIIDLEKVFEGPIVNPLTGRMSRKFHLSGKVDGIVQMIEDGSYWLLEHKTASQINNNYVEKLWTDFQITLYCLYLKIYYNIEIIGILYNILGKTTMKQKEGETEIEFAERYQKLIAKSKTGKSSAKRKMPETDEEFQLRLAEKYSQPEMFIREDIYITTERYELLQGELWKLTQSYLEAVRNDNFYCNTDYCFRYNSPCGYYPICSSGDSNIVIENYYSIVEPHEELECNNNDKVLGNEEIPF